MGVRAIGMFNMLGAVYNVHGRESGGREQLYLVGKRWEKREVGLQVGRERRWGQLL